VKDRKNISKGHMGEWLVQPLMFHLHSEPWGEGDYRCGAKSFNTHGDYMDEEKYWMPLPMCPLCFADRYPDYEGEMPKTFRDYINWLRKRTGWKGEVAIAGSDQHIEDQQVEEEFLLRSFVEVKE
tara:strand:- start:5758 stop:6132 length:375 start_codon:yes stop_codon:yes gene_type:complete